MLLVRMRFGILEILLRLRTRFRLRKDFGTIHAATYIHHCELIVLFDTCLRHDYVMRIHIASQRAHVIPTSFIRVIWRVHVIALGFKDAPGDELLRRFDLKVGHYANMFLFSSFAINSGMFYLLHNLA